MRGRRRAALLLAAVSAAACSGADDPTVAGSSTSRASAAPTTTTSGGAGTTAGAPAGAATTETTLADGCQEAGFGGHGTPIALADGSEASVGIVPRADAVAVGLDTAGGSSYTPLPVGAGLGPPPRIAAVLDLDGDGGDEVWVQAGSGASVLLYSLFRVDGCALTAVGVAGAGVPAEFAAGGTVGNQAGVFCTDSGAVVTVNASSEDGVTYLGDRVEHRLVDGSLVRGEVVPFEIAADDPAFPDLSAFRC